VTMGNGIQLGPSSTVNEVPFSHIVMKDDRHKDISGYKHAPHIRGDFSADNVNDVSCKVLIVFEIDYGGGETRSLA